MHKYLKMNVFIEYYEYLLNIFSSVCIWRKIFDLFIIHMHKEHE